MAQGRATRQTNRDLVYAPESFVMHQRPKPRYQSLTIIAQDPGVRTGPGKVKKIVRAKVRIPAETLLPGPWGYRVQVVDYDASSDTLWSPRSYEFNADVVVDPFENASDSDLLNDPQFHQQNVYAIVMRILSRFEQALGRRVSWSFGGHQLKVAPHAFADANAFYSKEDECLLFGYFADPKYLVEGKRAKPGHGIVFTCLSHDIVAHETTHALVDGLRERYTEPSSPDQAAFHEGISDVVALLSVFSLTAVVELLLADQNVRRQLFLPLTTIRIPVRYPAGWAAFCGAQRSKKPPNPRRIPMCRRFTELTFPRPEILARVLRWRERISEIPDVDY